MSENLENRLLERIESSGLLPYLSLEKSNFLELPDGEFVDLVVEDGAKLPEFRNALRDFARAETVDLIVRAVWRVESVGDAVQAYAFPPGVPVPAMQYPVKLRSGGATVGAWVVVTYLADQLFRRHGVSREAEKAIIRSFIESRLRIGGASYWDPERNPNLEITSESASYIVSRMRKQ